MRGCMKKSVARHQCQVVEQGGKKGGGRHSYLKVCMGRHPITHHPVHEFAHRLVLWALEGPPVHGDKQECMHICCNKMCLNPAHLAWGTHKQNMAGDTGPSQVARALFLEEGASLANFTN